MSCRTWLSIASSSVVGVPKAGIDERVEHVRRLRHRVGEARRGAEKIGEEQPQAVVRLQDGEEFDRGRHAAEGAVEGGERTVGIGGAAERREQRRRELGQHLAGARRSVIAGRRPKCQPRTVSATRSGSRKPRRCRVASVSGIVRPSR